jgi:hypothetical protein
VTMYRKSGTFASFAGKGFARREIFDHNVIAVPKAYPDAQLLLERRGLRPNELQRGQFYQLNLYTTDFYGLPDDLFTHPEINWHRQQLGQKGLIAAAGLWIRRSVATISTLQSDLCQQLYRHATLKRLCKTQVDTHFRYWYAILFNAILDLCLDFKILTIYSPTGHQVVVNTRKAVQPDLFCRIYDYPSEAFDCHKVTFADAQYWEIPVQANRSRLASLAMKNGGPRRDDTEAQLCIFHDVEENIDTRISSAECADNLARMLEIERSFGFNTTYDVLGMLFERKKDLIYASNPRHSIGFHSFNHDLGDLAQLPKCRSVDLRVRGYRPPKSRITSELTNYRLAQLNFEWFACSARRLGHSACRLENGIVRIPIHLDDHSLFMGKPYEQWESELLGQARAIPYFGLGLHDCYAGKWLGHYADLLEKLLTKKQVVSADEICDSIFLDPPAQPPRRFWS